MKIRISNFNKIKTMKHILLLIFTFLNTFSFSQVSEIDQRFAIKVDLYKNQDSFYEKTNWGDHHMLILEKIKEKKYQERKDYLNNSPQIISFSSVYDTEIAENFYGGYKAWGMIYQNQPYFNMLYAVDFQLGYTFVKYDVMGKNYNLIFIKKDSVLERQIGGSYPTMGLTGVLMSESTKWGTNFSIDDTDEKIRILFVDLNDQKENSYRQKGALGKLLHHKDLKKIAEKYKMKKKKEKMTFNQVVQFFETINQQ